MSDFFLGEIRLFPYGFAPTGWSDCDGKLLQINQNSALFALLGKQFGGNGTTTFALPDLRGRVAVYPAAQIGEQKGVESYALTAAEVPSHTHVPQANKDTGTDNKVTNNVWAAGAAGQNLYGAFLDVPAPVAINANCVQNAGGGQPHSNMQPYQVLRYCIAVMGIWPPRQ